MISSKAIVSILLLLTTFGFGIKCFADFGKGLYDSKNSGQLIPLCWSLHSHISEVHTEHAP